MKNSKIPAAIFVGALIVVAGGSRAHAELLVGKTYTLSGTETAFYCVGNPKERLHPERIWVFRASENDVFVYFGKASPVKLNYQKIKSGVSSGSINVTEGDKSYRDSATLSMSGNDVTLKASVKSLSNTGRYSAVWDFSSNDTSCQLHRYSTPMLCAQKGIGTGYKNAQVTSCEITSGPPN